MVLKFRFIGLQVSIYINFNIQTTVFEHLMQHYQFVVSYKIIVFYIFAAQTFIT